jgi:hypothetical protein
MIIKIGEQIAYNGEQFVVVHITQEQIPGKRALCIMCVDPETADQEQQEQMKVEQVNHSFIDLLRKAVEEGGKGGLFNIYEGD